MSRNKFLYALVFVVGTASLGAEIAAVRLMAPFFGASTIVWANTIAIVLVALSIGYWFGGRLADRHPHLRGLCLLVLVASLILGLVPIVANPFLSLSVDAFDTPELHALIVEAPDAAAAEPDVATRRPVSPDSARRPLRRPAAARRSRSVPYSRIVSSMV